MSQAIEAGRHGDSIRLFHGEKRRNSSRAKGKAFQLHDNQGVRAAFPASAAEREEVVKAVTRDDANHVFETRSARCQEGCVLCWI